MRLTTNFAAFVSVACPAFAQDVQVLDEARPAGTEVSEDERQTGNGARDGLRVGSWGRTGVFIEAPIGKVSVGPQFVEGGPVYERRTTVDSGIIIVELSISPVMPDLPSNGHQAEARPDQPASW